MKLTAGRQFLFRAVSISMVIVCSAAVLAGCAMPKINLQGLMAPQGAPVIEGTATPETASSPTAEELAEPTRDDSIEPGEASEDSFTEISGASLEWSGLVLFTSKSADPLAQTDAGSLAADSPERYLWAVAVDGTRAGRITPEGSAGALVEAAYPENQALVLADGFDFDTQALSGLPLPEACQGGGCSDFQFGLQGRTFAYLSGEDTCGRTLTLVERANNQVLNTWQGVAWYYFYGVGSMILAQGGCDQRYVYHYIPNTGQQASISPEGEMSWDPAHRAALVQLTGDSPAENGLWGFNLETSAPILWSDQGKIMQDTPIWLDDGHHFVYQHRGIRYDPVSGNVYLDGPRQIVLMDAYTRSQQLIGFEQGYDYHLCQTQGEPCEQVYGDWLKIYRTPFTAGGIKLGDAAYATINRCALFGYDCLKPSEEYALNWKTGELLPWSEAGVSLPSEPVDLTQPDLSTEPVYTDAGGDFALYTSFDRRGLWYVPVAGDPVQWVTDGENFVYIP